MIALFSLYNVAFELFAFWFFRVAITLHAYVHIFMLLLYDWLVSDNDTDASSAIMVAKNISSHKWHAAIKIVNKTFD